MKKSLALSVFLVGLVASSFFAYRWQKSETRLRENTRWIHAVMDSLATTVDFPNPPYQTAERDSLYWQWIATTARMQSRAWQQAVRHWVGLRSTLLDEADIARLKEEGLEDPPRQLRASLMARVDLIPYPGVLGGTMGFEEDRVVLLEPPYAFAGFGDGHEQGSMLLEYSVKSGGQIDWKRLWAALE